MRFLTKLLKDESGATAIEYGLIAGLISVVIVVAVGAVGEALTGTFEYIAEQLTGAVGS